MDVGEKELKSSKNLMMQLSAAELSAIIMKGSPNSNDRDAGFCSGGSEGGDDLSIDHLHHEPSSPSEDSINVKVTPIALVRNKRKSSEPAKLIIDREKSNTSVAPLKKRLRNTSSMDTCAATTTSTNNYWEPSHAFPHELIPNPANILPRHPGVTTLHRIPTASEEIQQEPLALVLKKTRQAESADVVGTTLKANSVNKSKRQKNSHTEVNELLSVISDSASINESDPCISSSSRSNSNNRPQQRNYKNMTRERRIEANARERTRVHTISAAYETLRHAVPSYSSSQKLSKLSVLRVACSYILTLSRLAGEDYSEDQSAPNISSCFDSIAATIQTEGKVKRKRED